ncbi:MAG: hypothetical protein B7Y76_04270, partial [Sphingobacteriia bacterium 35-40-5]
DLLLAHLGKAVFAGFLHHVAQAHNKYCVFVDLGIRNGELEIGNGNKVLRMGNQICSFVLYSLFPIPYFLFPI